MWIEKLSENYKSKQYENNPINTATAKAVYDQGIR